MGKMKVADHHVMDDVRSLVMMTEGKCAYAKYPVLCAPAQGTTPALFL